MIEEAAQRPLPVVAFRFRRETVVIVARPEGNRFWVPPGRTQIYKSPLLAGESILHGRRRSCSFATKPSCKPLAALKTQMRTERKHARKRLLRGNH